MHFDLICMVDRLLASISEQSGMRRHTDTKSLTVMLTACARHMIGQNECELALLIGCFFSNNLLTLYNQS